MITTIRRTLLIGIPIAIFIISGAWLANQPQVGESRDQESKQLISEDDPRWDCTRLGNRLCGPIPPASVAQALYDVEVAQRSMDERCYFGYAWAEYNATAASGYEVLGYCPPA